MLPKMSLFSDVFVHLVYADAMREEQEE